MNLKTLKRVLPVTFKSNLVPLIVGTHGIGKSQIVRETAKEMGIDFIDLRVGTQEVGDLLGLPNFTKDDNGTNVTEHCIPNWFPKPGTKGIIFLDEFNRGRRDVVQALFQFILDRRIHTHVLPDGWLIAAAINPADDNYVVMDLADKALLSRFCVLDVKPTPSEFLEYAEARGFDRSLITFLREHKDVIQVTGKTELVDEVTPDNRAIEAFNRVLALNPEKDVLFEVSSGLVGRTVALKYQTWMESQEKPIDAELVINSYSKVKKAVKEQAKGEGQRIDMLSVTTDTITAMLSAKDSKWTEDQVDNVLEYLSDIPPELARKASMVLYQKNEIFKNAFPKSKAYKKISELKTKVDKETKAKETEEKTK